MDKGVRGCVSVVCSLLRSVWFLGLFEFVFIDTGNAEFQVPGPGFHSNSNSNRSKTSGVWQYQTQSRVRGA